MPNESPTSQLLPASAPSRIPSALSTSVRAASAAFALCCSAGTSPPAEPPPPIEDIRPAAILRGGSKGLEIMVHGRASVDAIASAVADRLAEAPSFFRGCDARVRVEDGPLPAGCLARLDGIAVRFEIKIVEVTAVKPAPVPVPVPDQGSSPEAVPAPQPTPEPEAIPAATASAPISIPITFSEPAVVPEPAPAAAPEPAPAEAPASDAPLTIVGPIRSGVILEHVGHIVVFGDVNPGAEIRSQGNIVVLGRLRGTAHAGIGRDAGFILSLRLEPQQLRIGRLVARASDSDKASSETEIAHATGDTIIVERYHGKLPRSLAASI